MKIKTKHEEYKDFLTKKQLAELGLIPAANDKGVELWTNPYMSKSATYYDSNKAVKLETVYIWKNYFNDDYGQTIVEIGAINVLFSKAVKPSKEYLSRLFNADTWIDVARKNGFSGYDILFANSENIVERQLVSTIKKQKYVKHLISYNVDFNIPSSLVENKAYQKVDLMELFANVVKESYKNFYGEEWYKWQKLEKFLEYYDVKPDSNSAVDYAKALRKCYEKMSK